MPLSKCTTAASVTGTNKLSMKVCGKCKLRKTTYEFYRNRSKLDGFESSCVLCTRGHTRKELAARRKSNTYIQRLQQAAVRRHAMKRCGLLPDGKSTTHWKLVLTSVNEKELKIADDVHTALPRECSAIILSTDKNETPPAMGHKKDINVRARLKVPQTKLAVFKVIKKTLGTNAMVKTITPDLDWN